ncbi:MAG: DUF4869 domain-containing protein [Eubacterium sp.]|nr:DUF4869 domain-containing protein [Eubacterium sp.]
MLKIIFGETEDVYYGPSWFKYNYDTEWLKDDFVQKMIEDVDKSHYVDGEYIESDVLGPITPVNLSGGLMTLISIYKNPEMVFDATSCGGNCAKWLIEMGRKQDVTINLKYLMKFKDYEPFDIFIVNDEKEVHTNKEYVGAAIEYV